MVDGHVSHYSSRTTIPRKISSHRHVLSRTSSIKSQDRDIEMEDSIILSVCSEDGRDVEGGGGGGQYESKKKGRIGGMAQHTLGLILLLAVVFLWTTCNFLGSSIFADASYAKPFFLTYLNTSMFTLCMLPRVARGAIKKKREGQLGETIRLTFTGRMFRAFWHGKDPSPKDYLPVLDVDVDEEEEQDTFLKPTDNTKPSTTLGLIPTARLSLTFCLLWFSANYFAMSCLQYTTVASTTILTSTSSIWTLLIGALTRTEKFTWRKLCGVLGSLVGVILISQLDLQVQKEDTDIHQRTINQFDFPDKPPYELALGDALALFSAIIYGFYTIALKKTTVSALPKHIHMPTFFGFVGIFNIVLLFPLFPLLHFTGLETFVLPPTQRIWTILMINSVSSLVSDICWAYAMVFTSPLVVTVGLSLTIPLSLVGEMIIQGRSESWVYWLGAMIVVGSFVFVEREEKNDLPSSGDTPVIIVRTEDFGEPGPAIVVEDYDDMVITRRERSPSPLSMMADEDDDGRRH